MSFYTKNYNAQEVADVFLNKSNGNVADATINCFNCHKVCPNDDYLAALDILRAKLSNIDKKYIQNYIEDSLLTRLFLS